MQGAVLCPKEVAYYERSVGVFTEFTPFQLVVSVVVTTPRVHI